MSIQFNRENVNHFWQGQRANGKPPQGNASNGGNSALSQALNDHQLTRQEYASLKAAFLKEQPNGDFDQWLADALDGNLDQKASAHLRSELGELAKQGNATQAISFALNDDESGYDTALQAKTYEQKDWAKAARAADQNKDGRLNAEEAAQAPDLPAHLKQNLAHNRAVLTYNAGQHTVSYYPAQDRPRLNARYEDLKLQLDVDLKDVDGIGDTSRQDISGTTSGRLTFDWNGPLVDGIRKAVEEESGGWVEADTRWVDDKRSGGPGYVIQARSGIIATRPIIIKSDAGGQVYLESPGFGSSVRLRLGEHGLKKYALPQLKAMGLDLEVERRDDRIYLKPKTLSVQNIPLALDAITGQQAKPSGQLQLDLAKGTRFEASASGLQANFDGVTVTGSSQAQGAPARADAQPDRIQGRLEAGLNYDFQKGRLDTEVVLKDTTVQLSLDAREMKEQLYLPRTLAEKAGDHLEAVLNLEGRYRNVNGGQHEGEAQGFLELKTGQDTAYGRIKTELGQSRLALSALGVSGTRGEDSLKVQAQQGQVSLDRKSQTLDVQGVSAQAQLNEDRLLSQVRNLLKGPQPVAMQLRSVLSHAGIQDQDLELLAQGKEDALSHLLSDKTWLSKIEKAVVEVQSARSQIRLDEHGVSTSHQDLQAQATGQDRSGQQSRVQVSAKAREVETHMGTDTTGAAQQRFDAQQLDAQLTVDHQDDQGQVHVKAQLSARQSHLDLQKPEEGGTRIDLQFNDSEARAQVKAQVNHGPTATISGEAHGLNIRASEKDLDAQATQVSGQAHYESKRGSSATLSGDAAGVRLQQTRDGEWQVNVPDARAKVEMELALDAVKELLKGADLDSLAALPQSRSQAETQAQLSAAGLSDDHARQAASLLWKPELQHLLKTSDFIEALKTSKHLSVTSNLQGELQARFVPGQGLEATGAAQVSATAALKADAQSSQPILSAQANANVTLDSNAQRTQLATPALEVSARAQQADGTPIGHFESRIEDLEASLSGEAQRVRSGAIDGTLAFQSVLDEAKIAQIQTLLTDFKDDLLLRLDKLGINRQQFENILQAFGKTQLEALFKALKPEDVAAMSEDLGLSQRQIQQLTTLLNQEPFQKVVQNLFAYSELLTDADAHFKVQVQSEGAQWSRQDQQMLASLHGIHLQASAESATAQGGGELQIDVDQEQISYRQQGADAELRWGEQNAQASGRMHREEQGETVESVDVTATLDGGAGSISREQGRFRSHMDASQASLDVRQSQADGSTGTLKLDAEVTRIDTQGTQDEGVAQVQGLHLRSRGTLKDSTHKGEISGQGELRVEQLQVDRQSVTAEQMNVSGEVHSQYRFVDDESSSGDAQFNLHTDAITSHATEGVSMAEGEFDAAVHTELLKGDTPRAEMNFAAREGTLRQLEAKDGSVAFESLNAELEHTLKTPMARGQVEGHLQVEGYHSENKVQRAEAFVLDDVEGKVHLKTEQLRELLSRSKDAQAMLETISQRWTSQADTPQFFTNDEITLNLEKGRIQGDARDGNALSGGQTINASLQLPDLETRLGSTQIQLNLERLSLDSTRKTEVELSGTAQFSPRQPEFDQSVQALVDQNLKAAGLNLKPEVHFVNGKFEVKIDRWFVDGLVNIDFKGDNIELSVDRAKLLHFLNTKKLATRLSESQLNNYLLDVQRDGNLLNLSLNEFSQSLLHRDNLQIEGIDTHNGKIEARFRYTDTPTYNAGYRARQQAKLQSRLFEEANGSARSENALEDRVEDLSPKTLQRVFKTANTQQLRQMLQAVGNDYDNVVRKAIKGEGRLQDYPVANRAILAANLARSSGFLERVGSEEKALIQQILASVTAAQQPRFQQALSAEEWARIQKYGKR